MQMPSILKSISKYLKLIVGLIAVFVICLSFADQIKIIDETYDDTFTVSFNRVFFGKYGSVIGFIGYVLVFLMGVFAVLSFWFDTLPNKGKKLVLIMNSLALICGLLGFIFIALIPTAYGEAETCSWTMYVTDFDTFETECIYECFPDLVKFTTQSLTALITAIVGFVITLYTFIVEFPYPQKKQVNNSSDSSEEKNI